jgi:hypothetical protein
MRQIHLVFSLFMLAVSASLPAQTSPAATPTPQTARQALLEMFLSKTDDAFTKHLTDDARQTLIRKGETPETSAILRIATLGRQLMAQSEHPETFETGPTLLLSEQKNQLEKIEVNVERDSLIGDSDEIELSVHYYKNGQLQSLPVVPSLTFTFQQEKEVWKLTEVTASAHVPLTDPDYLKGLRKQQDEANEGQAQMRLSIIAGAETTYQAKHPDLGYSCSLQTLFARDPNASPGDANLVYDPGQGSGDWNQYHFALTGCEGNPATKFHVTATPADADAGMKTFCSDESGAIKFVQSEKPSSCLSRGKPVNSGNEGAD